MVKRDRHAANKSKSKAAASQAVVDKARGAYRGSLFKLPKDFAFLKSATFVVSEATELTDHQRLSWDFVHPTKGVPLSVTLFRRALQPLLPEVEDDDYRSHTRLLPKVQAADPPRTLSSYLSDLERVMVVLCVGGYFSVAYFEAGVVRAHKSFSHYVVRKGQGQRQANRDRQSGGRIGRSVGSHIRRDQEVKHDEEIVQLFSSPQWVALLRGTQRVFYYAPGPTNKSLIVRQETGLLKTDPRLVSVPLAVERPSFHEVQRVFAAMVGVEVIPQAGNEASWTSEEEEGQQVSGAPSSSVVTELDGGLSLNESSSSSSYSDGEDEPESDSDDEPESEQGVSVVYETATQLTETGPSSSSSSSSYVSAAPVPAPTAAPTPAPTPGAQPVSSSARRRGGHASRPVVELPTSPHGLPSTRSHSSHEGLLRESERPLEWVLPLSPRPSEWTIGVQAPFSAGQSPMPPSELDAFDLWKTASETLLEGSSSRTTTAGLTSPRSSLPRLLYVKSRSSVPQE